MTTRPPLVNRALVGLLAIGLTVGGVLTVTLDSYENPWAGSLIRVGVVLGMLWLALPTATRPAAWSGMSPWITVVVVAIAILAARRPWLFFPLAGTVVFATLVLKPRPRKREPGFREANRSPSGPGSGP